jgi:UDP-glucuronate 4-epimerase
MKILLTGYRGFIGSRMFEELKKEHEVYGYDLVEGNDIRDKFKLAKLFDTENFDCVINLAARAGVRMSEDFPEEYITTNLIGLQNLISLSEKCGIKKFIHYSSSSVFDSLPGHASKESDSKNPISVYAVTKLAGECLVKKSKLNYTIIRPFTVIGENGRKEMALYKWINQVKAGRPITFFGDGTTSRGYTYVEDIIRGTIECLTNPNADREEFNMGGDQIVKLEELYNIFKSVLPVERIILPMPEADQKHYLADTSKARMLLGWKHQTDIKKKIKQIIESELKSNPV